MTSEERVRESFSKQTVMHTIGARLLRVGQGEVDIALPYRSDLCQQHGFLHAGIITTVVDSACGYAALSMMPVGSGVLSIEFKVNLLRPAKGQTFLATGRVIKAGRTITVCQGELAVDGEPGKAVATMVATMMTVKDRPGIQD